VAYANNPHSISRLHDDELLYVLGFLPLKELAELVQRSRRFNAVARKERSRGLHSKGGANIVLPSSSALIHHVTSLHLERHSDSDAPLTREMLLPLCRLPRLKALQLTLNDAVAVAYFMQGLTSETAVAALRAVLPAQLRSFSVTVSSAYSRLSGQHTDLAALASSFWAALGNMTQLTELYIEQHSERMHVRPQLAQLSHLRKLTLGTAGVNCHDGEHVADLQRLSQLRELTLLDEYPERIRRLCQPPHPWQLESLTLPSLKLDEDTMRALLHLSTLTALIPERIAADAWPLFPQLSRLRRLSATPSDLLNSEGLASFCVSLSLRLFDADGLDAR
jgi:hypothetical protein